MAKLTKLIDYAYMKEEVDIPQNIPNEELEGKILRAQKMLRMIIGRTFYADFVANFEANTLSTSYNLLFPYIKEFLAWQANEYWTFKANYKPTVSGFRTHREDNSDVPSDTNMAMIVRDAKQEAQAFKAELVSFLNSNSASYPLYSNKCNDVTGNTFHISVVSRKHKHDCGCSKCRC